MKIIASSATEEDIIEVFRFVLPLLPSSKSFCATRLYPLCNEVGNVLRVIHFLENLGKCYRNRTYQQNGGMSSSKNKTTMHYLL